MSQGTEHPKPASVAHWIVDDNGLHLPHSLDQDATYDVLLNGQHVWSLLPTRDARLKLGVPVARWPKALRPHLCGNAEVSVRDHANSAVLSTTQHVFGGDDTRAVSVLDRAGRPLILDKWGRLTRPMSHQEKHILDELMDASIRILDLLRDEAGVPSFICYGTLLGAVRNGKLIGHDNDIDLAYVSEHPYPVDVVREAYRIERILRGAGFNVRRGSGVRMNVRVKLSDGSTRCIDVFTAHWVEGVLYIPSDTGFRLPKETILPLGTISLMGQEVPAPAHPEVLLEATYGENWRVPDPSFKYTTPPALFRRLNGWFGGLITHRKHWDGFYAKDRARVPARRTAFARWVATQYPSQRPLVELGCGTGRDAFWFAGKKHRRVTAFDYNFSVVRRGNSQAAKRRLDVTFRAMNLYDTRAVLALGAQLARAEEPVDLYARFVLHALDAPGRDNLLRLASMSLRRGGLLFVEFRTHQDRSRSHVFGDHRRHYLRPQTVRAAIEAAGGRVQEQVVGTGLARFEDEDPHVCRLVASWSDPS